jgi:hypothetical protein
MSALSENPWPWQEPPKAIARGAFIVIEGLDRAGKSTQVKKLCDKLYETGHNIKTVRFPGNFILLLMLSPPTSSWLKGTPQIEPPR